MKTSLKILWGIVTVIPAISWVAVLALAGSLLVYIFTELIMPFHNVLPAESAARYFREIKRLNIELPILGGILLGFLIQISYFIHLVRADHLKKGQRTFWAVLFLVFHTLAYVPYWFLHVLFKWETKSKGEAK